MRKGIERVFVVNPQPAAPSRRAVSRPASLHAALFGRLSSMLYAAGSVRPAVVATAAFLMVLVGAASAIAMPVPDTTARQAYLVDLATGTVLLDKNGEARMAPSSMTKMMTAYLSYEAITQGRVTLDTGFTVSREAWKMGGSRMFLKLGSQVRVEDLLRGLLIDSGNDAAVALAEGLAGSETAFAEMMNAKARKLGMSDTHFMNASGWPDPNHYTTAHDLAVLAIHLIRDFPQFYHYESERTFTWNGIRQGNRNPLLYHPVSVDGIKTGHTEVGGYGLTASGERQGRRLVLVVNGLPSMQSRNDEPARLLDWAWNSFKVYPLLRRGELVEQAPVWMGTEDSVPVTVADDVALTLAPVDRNSLHVIATVAEPLPSPVQRGQVVGQLRIEYDGAVRRNVDLVAGADVPASSGLSALVQKLGLILP
ncbi:D-alanyl-D-alanine carboxypeptidase family protein [Azospirillum picis]|uniref:serine-type D-Ala-D-Ala carboxypeptidase n=1 Tax=Azospirillum picis TaxID=488438 RepID=A0ABU0MJF7_9PROT|nr:D-alanyl-D-alanine carboxypeptidase family protein [Azospirillum picis]MBP2299741.1 D-alanyl-D-alanine carboxypeptidase (penicillin-binding protein 5/6) [Azospirillum picis]MDQ0533537.1 D-alanyl-D-alanine carboxypeptidase (penicillin-binding protein 5/6) [Azospirillum picis]